MKKTKENGYLPINGTKFSHKTRQIFGMRSSYCKNSIP